MKKKKAVESEEGKHDCTFTVTIAKASEADRDSQHARDRGRASTRHEAIKAQTYFHCSYKLLPDDKESVKTDVVSFGIAAKLYADNDSRVLRTWNEGKLTWVAWQNSHKVEVTKDTLLKLFNHTLELKMWDSKDRVSTKARFDRPKGFKLPQSRGSDEVDFSLLREILTNAGVVPDDFPQPPSNTNESESSASKPERISSGKKKPVMSDTNRQNGILKGNIEVNKVNNQDEISVKVQLDKNKKPEFSKLLSLASSGIESAADDDQESEDTFRNARSTSQNGDQGSKKSGTPSRQSKRAKNEQQALYMHQHGLAKVTLEMAQFFTGTTVIANKLAQPAGTIESLIVTITLDCPLLSKTQEKALNPMIISLGAATNLPNGGDRGDTDEDKYKDTYACYTFFQEATHYTKKFKHNRKIAFNDRHVVLLGTVCKEKLLEYLQGPPLEIEVHDRDRAWIYKKSKCQAFGSQEGDILIGDTSYLSGMNVARNPFLGKERPWDPYGIAKVNLSGLLLGETLLEIDASICNCPLPNPLSKPKEAAEKRLSIPNYLECCSELKVKIELAHPLVVRKKGTDFKGDLKVTEHCPFNRIVYIFNYNNGKLLRQILSKIIDINSKALQLEGSPRDVLEAALSTYKLTDAEKTSKILDIITGFQVVDGVYHIFVLEGLQDQGISTLWNSLPQGSPEEESVIRVAYNSELMFSTRLYASLDVDITRVRLHKPLADIVQQPLLYVRDMIPKPCYKAVVTLHELTKTELIKDAVRNNLFPSAKSIVSLSKEFGIPLTLDDMQELQAMMEDQDQAQTSKSLDKTQGTTRQIKTSRAWTPIEHQNFDYEETLKERKAHFVEKNYIEFNKNQLEPKIIDAPPQKMSCDLQTLHLQRAHNYSTQSVNTMVKVKEKLRNELEKDSDSLFTYSKDYQSALFVPVDIDELRKKEKALSRKMWQTSKGFVYPGKKTSLEANIHPQKLDKARNEEIQKPWKENILHANILKPTVDRIVFPWNLREHDFDLLKPPLVHFGTKLPATIFLTGDTLKAELRDAAEEDKRKWQQKLVVDDPLFYTHRCSAATELTEKGFHSSSQLARLEDILKDNGEKFSLSAKGMKLDKLPALSVLLRSNEKTLDLDERSRSAPVGNSKGKSTFVSGSPGNMKELFGKRRFRSQESCEQV